MKYSVKYSVKYIMCLWGCLFLAACANGQGISLAPYGIERETPQNFKVCHGFGCSARTPVGLTKREWSKVTAPLRKRSKTAAAERKKIAKSVALMERVVQKKAGFNKDLGQATTFEKDQHQMDCLDETINTSRTLAFLDVGGSLRLNSVYEPIHRGYFIDGMWPHNSGAVRDNETSEIFAIDSYYSDNGGTVSVVPLSVWLDEWRPEGLRPRVIPPKPKRKPLFKG